SHPGASSRRSRHCLAAHRRQLARPAHQQHRDSAAMAHRIRHAAIEQIGEEPVPVRGHRDQVAVLAHGRLGDLARRIAAGQDRVHFEAVRFQRGGHPLQIFAVRSHLFALAQPELLDVARGPAVGDVNENHLRSAQAREAAHMFEDRRVVCRMLQRHENARVHAHAVCPRNMSTSSHTLSSAINSATAYATPLSHHEFTNGPIFRRSEVKRTSGTTAKESCMLRITWLRMSSFAVPCSPYSMATTAAGMMAMTRVMSRRSQGRTRMFRNPSITICPASVPVSVEFCPDASSASANMALAPVTPSSGVSSLYASWISATRFSPAR